MNKQAEKILHEIEEVQLKISLWQGYLEWLKAQFKVELKK